MLNNVHSGASMLCKRDLYPKNSTEYVENTVIPSVSLSKDNFTELVSQWNGYFILLLFSKQKKKYNTITYKLVHADYFNYKTLKPCLKRPFLTGLSHVMVLQG